MFPGGSEVEQADGVVGRIVEEVGPVRIRLHVPVAACKYKQKYILKLFSSLVCHHVLIPTLRKKC